jgi:hypothetical protein
MGTTNRWGNTTLKHPPWRCGPISVQLSRRDVDKFDKFVYHHLAWAIDENGELWIKTQQNDTFVVYTPIEPLDVLGETKGH